MNNRIPVWAVLCATVVSSYVSWTMGAALERSYPKPPETMTIGKDPDCSWTGNTTIWHAMNELEIYRWVVACEDKKGRE